MKCPSCKETNLVMSERQGIEIDYCPDCRGIWLDRGELDKIIEKTIEKEAPKTSSTQSTTQTHIHTQPSMSDLKHMYKHGHYKKKKHWLHDLFD
jgi:Zn-finger nucleic acid-binding protein